MKKLILLVMLLFISLPAFAQYQWESISMSHSSGPVSPEYQYNYTITIDAAGTGKLSYTKSGTTNDYSFNVSRSNLATVNKSLLNSNVLNANPDSLKSSTILMGGPAYNATITLAGSSGTVTIPNGVNENYRAGVFNMYEVIESVVPNSTWSKVGVTQN